MSDRRYFNDDDADFDGAATAVGVGADADCITLLADADHSTGTDVGLADRLAPRFFTYAEVACSFGRSPRTVRWWVKSGRLKAIKIGAARFIPEAEIERLLAGGEG